MPKKGEKVRKIKVLKEGGAVKPPKKWFDRIKDRVKEQYPKFGQSRIGKVVGGIWAKEPKETKIKIVKEYQK